MNLTMARQHTFEDDLFDLYERIIRWGEERVDRTGVGTIALFGEQLKIDLSKGFPLVTTKRVPFKSVLSELLWFIEGSGDERRLAEILHGTRDPSKKTIWSPNAEATTGSKFQPSYPGDLGRVYGVQWRKWQHITQKGGGTSPDFLTHPDGGTTYFDAKILVEHIDQLKEVIHKLKTNPTDRRIIMTAWNPGELGEMALPPCHMFVQFYLSNNGKLSAQMYQRSVDTFLGLPFNIASYALLVHMIAHVIDADVGELTLTLGDTHIYKNHQAQVVQQLNRTPHHLPQLVIRRKVTNIDDFKMEDFVLLDYNPDEAIKAPMAA